MRSACVDLQERAIMLERRKKTGLIVAIGYGWIETVEFEPSEGIKVHAIAQTICNNRLVGLWTLCAV
jgi:hypothetical protein